MSLHLYKILEFDSPVSIAVLKSRYKELAKKYHPDLNKFQGAEERFKLISSAYQQLLELGEPKIQQPAPKTPNARYTPRPRAEQTIFRHLDSKNVLHRIDYPADVIDANTRFYFMIDGTSEFTLFFERDTRLPTTVDVNLPNRKMQINIVTKYPY